MANKLIDFLFECSNIDKVAVVTETQSYSYFEIKKFILLMINRLDFLEIGSGKRVVVICDHDLDSIVFIAASSWIGLQILMPYNLQDAAVEEWINLIKSSNPDHVIFLKKNISKLNMLVKNFGNVKRIRLNSISCKGRIKDIEVSKSIKNFLVFFTSGTSGNPKAISISEKLICLRIKNVTSKLKF